MKKTINIFSAFILAAATITFTSCDKSPAPTPIHSEEEIEKIQVHFIKYDMPGILTTDTVTVEINESGLSTPIILAAASTYKMVVDPFSHEGSIAAEIKAEGTEHRFFFLATPADAIDNYVYLDADSDGRGIGLEGNITIRDIDFNLNIILKHNLDKAHPNAATYNDPSYHLAGGGEDINVKIAVIVE